MRPNDHSPLSRFVIVQRDARLLELQVVVFHQRADQQTKVQFDQLRRRVIVFQLHQLRGQSPGALGLAIQGLQVRGRVRSIFGQIRPQPDGRQRRPQLMRNVGDQPVFGFLLCPHSLEQDIEPLF